MRYSSTSNKGLLVCGFEVFRVSRPSYLDRLWPDSSAGLALSVCMQSEVKSLSSTDNKERKSNIILMEIGMGVNPGGGDGGRDASPQFVEWGDEYLIIPPLFDMFNEILFLYYLKT